MLRATVRSAVPRNVQLYGNRSSPRNCCDLPSLDVIRDKLHFRRVTLDIYIVITCADATIAQLLALYDSVRKVPTIGRENHDARALQNIGTFTYGCGDPAIVLPTARPMLPAT